MTFRFESTSMVGQRWLLHYQLPWLENVELVNTTVPLVIDKDQITGNADFFENGKVLRTFNLEGAGWGSVEASQMVLNNLFYITAKVGRAFTNDLHWFPESWFFSSLVELFEYRIQCGKLPGADGMITVLTRSKWTMPMFQILECGQCPCKIIICATWCFRTREQFWKNYCYFISFWYFVRLMLIFLAVRWILQ